MAGKTVSFDTNCNLYDSHLEAIAKWLSCNGEVWGVGPTAVFASAAALFLYNELEATIYIAGDHMQVSLLEKTMMSSMVVGMLALMIHLWVCAMRFFQYYLDTLIKDSPNVLLEMTTAGLLGGKSEMVPLGPLTRFLRQQQPQIHITVCWFLSLCYADYVRKNYCQRFNMPYLEQWQTELHERAARCVHSTMQKVNSFVGSVHQRLHGYAPPATQNNDGQTVSARPLRGRRSMSAGRAVASPGATRPAAQQRRRKSYACDFSANQARPQWMLLKNYDNTSLRQGAFVALRRTTEQYAVMTQIVPNKQSPEDYPWRKIQRLQKD